MKIFNWVHKKFHQRVDTKTEIGENEKVKHALLDHVVHANMLDSWENGILSIGTFGFDPLASDIINKAFKVDEYQKFDEEKDLKLAGFEGDLKEIVETNEEDVEMSLNLNKHGISLDSGVSVDLEDGKLKKKEERRITLADLFSAEYDEDVKTKEDGSKMKKKCNKKDNDVCDIDGKKKGYSFTKKFVGLGLGGDPNSHPIKKVKQLVRRMVKKKIHPSIEEKIQMNDGPQEALFLLQNKDATF